MLFPLEANGGAYRFMAPEGVAFDSWKTTKRTRYGRFMISSYQGTVTAVSHIKLNGKGDFG